MMKISLAVLTILPIFVIMMDIVIWLAQIVMEIIRTKKELGIIEED